MVTQARNFLKAVALNTATTLPKTVVSGLQVFVLRSLSPIVADEIPRRFSSSSLPPSFASGRFAGFSSSPLRRPQRVAARLG